MKKILSLFALLMITAVAFATDYTGKFTYETSVGGSESFDSKTLSVIDNGDGTYDVVVRDFNANGTIGQEFGDMTFPGLSGTTVDGLTTATGQDVNASQTNGTYFKFVASEATAKFNADKAYFHAKGKISGYYSFELTFGTDDFTTPGTEPFEPTTRNYHSDAYAEHDNTHYDIDGGVDIDVTEYEQGKYSITFKKFTDGFSIYGNLVIDNLTATYSDNGTAYNLTAESKAVWKNITPVAIMSGINENGEAALSDFMCTLGRYNDIALSLTVNVAGSDIKVVAGNHTETGVNGISADAADGNAQIFNIGGVRANSLQKGINIVRTADGKTVKVLRK